VGFDYRVRLSKPNFKNVTKVKHKKVDRTLKMMNP
jgi:hypothetical protein